MKDHVEDNDAGYERYMRRRHFGEEETFRGPTFEPKGPSAWTQQVSCAYLRRLEAVYAAAKDYIGAQPDSFKESRAIERLREALDPATSYDNG